MDINGFRAEECRTGINEIESIIIHDISDLSPYGFDLKSTFESGQAFRWKKTGENRYKGIVKGKAAAVSIVSKGNMLIENSTAKDFKDIWYDYFDLGTDYYKILKDSEKDDFMRSAIRFCGGARMLVQDFEETLFSYIISSQNNIPRIRGLVEDLCMLHGKKISGAEDDFSGFSFPELSELALNFCSGDEDDQCKCCSSSLCGKQFAGYRCPYIARTAQMLYSRKYVPDLGKLSVMPGDMARKDLQKLPGVGQKVADCVLLYSGIRKDICPIDTWVARTIRKTYLEDNSSIREIRIFTEDYFGDVAGYAQLWLFYYARMKDLR